LRPECASGRQQLAARQKAGHLIPQAHDRNEPADLIGQQVLVLERIAAVFDYDLRQRPVEILTADSEARVVGQDIDTVKD